MDDREYMLMAFKGDQAAVDLVLSVAAIAGTWDDLIDQDKPVAESSINRVFTACLLDLPINPFYQKHCGALLPVLATSIINYQIANQYERGTDVEGHVLAHTLRYSIADLPSFIAYLIGGMEWAAQVAPELRRRSQKDTISNYLCEIKNKQADRSAQEVNKHA